eukprot:5997300-Alexandrium_andersonii.AAC.1
MAARRLRRARRWPTLIRTGARGKRPGDSGASGQPFVGGRLDYGHLAEWGSLQKRALGHTGSLGGPL